VTLSVVLDTGPLSELAHPSGGAAVKAWAAAVIRRGALLVIPAIADYEVRRELARLGRRHSIARLDDLAASPWFVPITQEALLLAADYWAAVRAAGRPTADAAALDGDAILAAQATTFGRSRNSDIVVATTNARHISRFVPAANWPEIVPP
jgi:predicted nucleic acid-binding protein